RDKLVTGVQTCALPIFATSANRPGEPDPRRLDDVPAQFRDGAAAVVDGGELPGTPSTVVDITGPEPRILREGAVPGEEVLRRLRSEERRGGKEWMAGVA